MMELEMEIGLLGGRVPLSLATPPYRLLDSHRHQR